MPIELRSGRITAVVISLLLLLAVLLVFTDPWSILRRDGGRVILENPGEVNRITLSDGTDTVRLIRRADTWLLDGVEPASRVAVENLLYAAANLQVRSMLLQGTGERAAVVRRISFYREDNLLLSYEFSVSEKQYLVRPLQGNRAYYVNLPGHGDLALERVFSVTPEDYLEHVLIDLLPSEIALLEIERAGGEAVRFRQDREGNIACSVPPDWTEVPRGKLKELPVRLLFSYFTAVRYEERSEIPADSLLDEPWEKGMLARVRVESHGGASHTLRVFPLRDEPGADPHMFLALVAYNDWPEALVVNYIHLDVLIRDPSHYFEEDG